MFYVFRVQNLMITLVSSSSRGVNVSGFLVVIFQFLVSCLFCVICDSVFLLLELVNVTHLLLL